MKRSTLPTALVTASAPTVSVVHVPGLVTAADPAGRTITGRVVVFGQVGPTSAGPTRFAAGALTAADARRIKLLVEHDPERVVGYATAVTPDDKGITATFHVPDTPAGTEVLASAAAGLRDGLSVGVHVTAATRGADGALDVSAAEWRETSVVSMEAIAGSYVTNVAASGAPLVVGQPPAPALVPPSGLGAPLAPVGPLQLGAAGGARVTGRPVDLSAVFTAMAAAWQQEGASGLIRAALTDIVPPTDQATRDLDFPVQWLGELFTARNDGRRPMIDRISHKPLTSIRVQGFRKVYPRGGVAEYAGSKAAVPSTGTFTLEPVWEDAKRAAGAHDVDRVYVDLGSPSWLQGYFEAQTDAYLELTESWAVAKVLNVAEDLGYVPDVLTGITSVAAYLGSIGAKVSYLLVAPDLYAAALGIPLSDAPWLFGGAGSANLTESTATVGNLRIEAEQNLAAGTILAGDSRASTHLEWKNPPLRVMAENIPQGGVDLGVFGYAATLVEDPRATVTVTVGTDPGAGTQAAPSKSAKS